MIKVDEKLIEYAKKKKLDVVVDLFAYACG